MLTRILLDNEDWLLTTSLLGKIKVHLKNRALTRTARRDEREYLMQVCEALSAAGVPIEPTSEILMEFFEEFAAAVFSRGGPRWQAFFVMHTPQETARLILSDLGQN